MKLGNKLSFGVNAVISGQKVATVKAIPQLIANSTAGKFQVTSPVSKALNVAVGEHIMFLNNIAGVEQAVQARVEDVVNFAAENNFDLSTREGEDAVVKALTQWFIAKGVPQYKANGEPIYATVRMTKEEKEKYLEDNKLSIAEANREALVEQYGEMSNEELAEKITIDMVDYPKYHVASGSRTATSSNGVGVGYPLTFTDSAIWNALKIDLGDDANKKNRIFDVALDDAQMVDYNNGKEVIKISIYPINFVEDAEPILRGKKD